MYGLHQSKVVEKKNDKSTYEPTLHRLKDKNSDFVLILKRIIFFSLFDKIGLIIR